MQSYSEIESQFRPAEKAPSSFSFGAGLGTWFISVALIFVVQIVAVLIYLTVVSVKNGQMPTTPEQMLTKGFALVAIGSTFIAHILTVLFCWLLITKRLHLPFLNAQGWNWHPKFRLMHAVILGGLMILLAIVCSQFLKHTETDMDKMLKLGTSIRILTVILAVFSAPFVEEFVYRGILYPGLENATRQQIAWLTGCFFSLIVAGITFVILPSVAPQFFGSGNSADGLLIGVAKLAVATVVGAVAVLPIKIVAEKILEALINSDFGERQTVVGWSIAYTALLFALVHVPQYWGSTAAITTIMILSVVLTLLRTYTGSILPTVATHFVYNGVQSIMLLAGLTDDGTKEKATQALIWGGQWIGIW